MEGYPARVGTRKHGALAEEIVYPCPLTFGVTVKQERKGGVVLLGRDARTRPGRVSLTVQPEEGIARVCGVRRCRAESALPFWRTRI